MVLFLFKNHPAAILLHEESVYILFPLGATFLELQKQRVVVAQPPAISIVIKAALKPAHW